MEPAGLAIGIAGLAGLFSSVLEAVDRINDYRSFNSDSRELNAQFDGYRALLERWGRDVGLENGGFSTDHQATLDPQILAAAKQLLQVAKEVLESVEPPNGMAGHSLTKKPTVSGSRRSKLGWALGGKAEQTKKANSFGRIVRQLFELVPVQPTDESESVHREGTVIEASFLNLNELVAEIRELNTQMARDQKTHVERELVAWVLGNTTPNERYRDSLQKRLEGTCDWIFDERKFIDWTMKDASQSTRPLLWIHGHAGFGKTILCAQIIQRLLSSNDRPVAYFFFSSDFASRDDPYIAVRSWISQLLSKNTVAFEVARDMWNDAADHIVAPQHIVIQLLRQIVSQIPWCTLIADGLDECLTGRENGGKIGQLLHDILDAMADTTRVLIVSRDETKIRQALEYDYQEVLSQFRISSDHVHGDTVLLSQHIVNKKLANKPQEIKRELSDRLSSRCDGQFIWLMIQEPVLRRGRNFLDLKRAIDETPAGLDQLYERNWKSTLALNERDRHRAFSLLRWVIFSSRPLTIGEITEAVLLDESLESFPIDGLPDAIDDDYIDTEILGLCGPLVEVRNPSNGQPPESRTVHISHFTIRVYLIYQIPCRNLQSNDSLRSSNERMHNYLLSYLCLIYIRCYNSRADARRPDRGVFDAFFLDYATSTWDCHMAKAAKSETDSPVLDQGVRNVIQVLLKTEALAQSSGQAHQKQLLLHSAAQNGHIGVVQILLALGAPTSATDIYGYTSISVAARAGEFEITRLLLNVGADTSINTSDNLGNTPLNLAAYDGHLEIVRLLLDRGADLSIANTSGCTPLIYATNDGHLEIVSLLLDRGADLSIADKLGCTPLIYVAWDGYLEIVSLLLDRGADLSIADKLGYTPLIHAAWHGHLEIVTLLLDRGADLSIADTLGCTPLIYAAWDGHLKIVSLLLDRGADPSIASVLGYTPLLCAVCHGHLKIVTLLLDRGADLSIADKAGRTPLIAAAWYGHLEIVFLLLDRGVATSTQILDSPTFASCDQIQLHSSRLNPDRSSNDLTANSQSGLQPDAFPGSTKSDNSKLLGGIPNTEVNRRDNCGCTALFYGSIFGHADVVRLLLSSTHIDPTLPNYMGVTALHTAVINGYRDVVELLLGSDRFFIDSRDSIGRPMTWWATRSSSPETAHILKEYAQSHSIPFELGDICLIPNQVSDNSWIRCCDACARLIPPTAVHYLCIQCCEGNFYICEECFGYDVNCLDRSHTLQLQKPDRLNLPTKHVQ